MADRDYAHAFTVFTSTYNRARTLPRVYASLRTQTFRDFEWLVVDDGSTDDTRTLVASWRDAGFPIRYVFQENSGKHVAFNRAVREARGELFLTLDSDDALVPNALERFRFHWNTIPAEQKARFSAVTSLCMDQHGNVVGDRFPRDVMDSDSLELHFRYRVSGEKFGFHRTDVLRAHPFPELEGVKFVSESIVWFAIARRYRTRFVNECLRVYTHDDSGGESLSSLTPATALGRLMFHEAILNEYVDYIWRSPRSIMRSLVNYCRYSFVCGVEVPLQFTRLTHGGCRVALGCALPLGYMLSLRDAAKSGSTARPRPT